MLDRYHDHAIGITAVNAYFGQAGFYILEDKAVSDKLGLPTGNYDIPLMISTKQFLPSGKLLSPKDERDSLYGDVTTVNGQPWPYMKTEPRKYKFRLLDASVSRSYSLYLVDDSAPNTKLDFTVVGGDCGYLDHPVVTKSLDISMAERYEIIIDFDKYKGKNLTLMNARDFQTNLDYPATDRVIRFTVGNRVTSSDGNGNIPDHLSDIALPAPRTTVDQSFEFGRTNGQWLINGVGFEGTHSPSYFTLFFSGGIRRYFLLRHLTSSLDTPFCFHFLKHTSRKSNIDSETVTDVKNRVVAFPPRGKVQRWRLTNKSGGKS